MMNCDVEECTFPMYKQGLCHRCYDKFMLGLTEVLNHEPIKEDWPARSLRYMEELKGEIERLKKENAKLKKELGI